MSYDATQPRVGIDGLNLAIPRGTGVATYARALSHCLKDLGHAVDVIYGLDIAPEADPALQEVQFFDLLETERSRKPAPYPSRAWAAENLRASRGLHAFPIPITGRVIAAPFQQRLGRYDRILNVRDLFPFAARYFRNFGRFVRIRVPDAPAVMHWTYPVPVVLEGARNLYTIHDLVPLRMPWATLDNKEYYRRLLQGCIARGDGIVTVSEASRRDILDAFPNVLPERVTNTYQAVTRPGRMAGAEEAANTLRGAFDLRPGGYFLFFGSIEPKKNVGRLLEAYLASGLELPLVIVGARAWKSEGELALLKQRPEGDRRVRQVDYLPTDVLAMLVQGARAVAFPSLYEGFGLPMLEAMALGTPVLTSREGALAEVGGDAALYVDPYDCADIGAGLRRLAGDDALCADLHARGRAQAERFSMEAYRERVAALYRTVLQGPAGRPRPA